jgi:hypothetical protein
MSSKKIVTVEHPELSLVRKANVMEAPYELVARKKTFLASIVLCVQLSGLEDKEIYLTLGIDAGHWSRIMKGDAHFPVDKLDELMTLCGNEAPLQWLSNKRGYQLVMLKSAAERRIEELERQLTKETERRQWAEDLVVGRK